MSKIIDLQVKFLLGLRHIFVSLSHYIFESGYFEVFLLTCLLNFNVKFYLVCLIPFIFLIDQPLLLINYFF